MSSKEKTIKLILEDLYKIDPSLREHEQELIEIISQLIEAKPTAELDAQFRQELRAQVLEMAQEIKLNTKFGKSKFTWADAFMGQFLKPAGLVVAGILLAVIIGVPFVMRRDGGVQELESPFAFKVTQTTDEAFGSLVAEQQVVPEAQELGKGGGGPVSASKEAAVEEAPLAVPSPIPMPLMQRVNYNYAYKGDDFTIDQDKMPVFQKQKDSPAASAVGSYLSSMNLGTLDLSRFKNIKLEEFTIIEDRAEGYSVHVQLREGAVSISKNWAKWPQELHESLDVSDIPQDEAMIAVADKFIRDYGIDLANYGKGKVNKDWMRNYGAPEMSGISYVPSTMAVVYPLIVDGKKVYERSGYEAGLQVSVDVKAMKAVGLWNLSSQNYESSLYETETDVSKVLEAARQGQRKYSFENPTQTLEFELGTPEQVLVKTYIYGPAESKEFLAPALMFPVIKAPDEAGYYQENIVVPLVKELLENESTQAYPAPRVVPVVGPVPEPVLAPNEEVISSPAPTVVPPQE